jgi:hypothetical protein
VISKHEDGIIVEVNKLLIKKGYSETGICGFVLGVIFKEEQSLNPGLVMRAS